MRMILTGTQRDRQTARQTDRQTDRQTETDKPMAIGKI